STHHCSDPHLSFSPKLLRIILPATLTTTDRGTKRSASTITRLLKPDTTCPLPRPSAFIAVSTTSSAVWAARAGGLCPCAASKKLVSVTPGHKANTSMPYGRFSSQMASENESTKAFVAAYVAINGTG